MDGSSGVSLCFFDGSLMLFTLFFSCFAAHLLISLVFISALISAVVNDSVSLCESHFHYCLTNTPARLIRGRILLRREDKSSLDEAALLFVSAAGCTNTTDTCAQSIGTVLARR